MSGYLSILCTGLIRIEPISKQATCKRRVSIPLLNKACISSTDSYCKEKTMY
jgi:hypothetical protein